MSRLSSSIVRFRFGRGSIVRLCVLLVLASHIGLLAYGATRHSPTLNEPGHLVAGLSNWKFGRFELYRVNPPLTRMLAATPVLLIGCETDWSAFYDGPGARPVFSIGTDFIKANGERSMWLFILARWACLPISVVGALTAFCFARELYGHTSSGLIALTLWCFDPNILAHAELVTPDAAAAAFGLLATYTVWRWLKSFSWGTAVVAGAALGLALCSKMSWLILPALWPVLWLFWLGTKAELRRSLRAWGASAGQLLLILALGFYTVNLAYLFDGSLTRLNDYEFVSESLAGPEAAGQGGNAFRDSLLGSVPIPLPKQYVLGIDIQKRDFEDYGQSSFLRGEWREGGWWYYYLYGLVVKETHG